MQPGRPLARSERPIFATRSTFRKLAERRDLKTLRPQILYVLIEPHRFILNHLERIQRAVEEPMKPHHARWFCHALAKTVSEDWWVKNSRKHALRLPRF